MQIFLILNLNLVVCGEIMKKNKDFFRKCDIIPDKEEIIQQQNFAQLQV